MEKSDPGFKKAIVSIAELISKALPNVTIIAPDGKVITDNEGELGIYKKEVLWRIDILRMAKK